MSVLPYYIPQAFRDFLVYNSAVLEAKGIDLSKIPVHDVGDYPFVREALFWVNVPNGSLPPWKEDRAFVVITKEKTGPLRCFLGIMQNYSVIKPAAVNTLKQRPSLSVIHRSVFFEPVVKDPNNSKVVYSDAHSTNLYTKEQGSTVLEEVLDRSGPG